MSADAAVEQALSEMIQRRKERKKNFRIHGSQWQEEMRQLRNGMFVRTNPSEPFQTLSQVELALLESAIEGHTMDGRLKIFSDTALNHPYTIIRRNHLSRTQTVLPDEFRQAANVIVQILLDKVAHNFKLTPSETPILFAWRAGLSFAEPAYALGFRKFCHLGVKRNERTLETETYYQENALRRSSDQRIVIVDPMLATGNTIIFAIECLEPFGVKPQNIVVVSVISAPEGVDHVLTTFPGVRIVTGAHDEYLNQKGYIEPGLGDYGDRYFEGLGIDYALKLHEIGILSSPGYHALKNRILETAEPPLPNVLH